MIHRIELPIDNDRFIDNLCLSYRHDFGLMDDEQKNALRFECKLWLRSILSNAHRVSRCDDCKFNCFDGGGGWPPSYPEIYCGKGHWSGNDGEPYPENWTDPWNNCKDYEQTKP